MFRNFFKKDKNTEKEIVKQSVLKTAHERWLEGAEVQLEKYLKDIEESTKRGDEHCYLLADSVHPMRIEHIQLLLSKGYDISLSKKRSFLHDNHYSYWARCYWTKNSSGKLDADYDWQNEQEQ